MGVNYKCAHRIFIYSRAINCTQLAEEEQAERDCEINNYVNAILERAFGN